MVSGPSGRYDAALGDAVGRPALDHAAEVSEPGLRLTRQLDPHLVDRRLDVLVELVALLAHDLGRVDFLEERLRQPVDLCLGRFSSREDTEVDYELGVPFPFALEYQRRLFHLLLIPL